MINLCDLGFKRDPIMVFEDLMNQHLFGNRFIINPTTNQPWDRLQSSISQTTSFQITTVADLYYTFDQREYKRDPVVRQVRPPDLTLANIIFSTNQTRLRIPPRSLEPVVPINTTRLERDKSSWEPRSQ